MKIALSFRLYLLHKKYSILQNSVGFFSIENFSESAGYFIRSVESNFFCVFLLIESSIFD